MIRMILSGHVHIHGKAQFQNSNQAWLYMVCKRVQYQLHLLQVAFSNRTCQKEAPLNRKKVPTSVTLHAKERFNKKNQRQIIQYLIQLPGKFGLLHDTSLIDSFVFTVITMHPTALIPGKENRLGNGQVPAVPRRLEYRPNCGPCFRIILATIAIITDLLDLKSGGLPSEKPTRWAPLSFRLEGISC